MREHRSLIEGGPTPARRIDAACDRFEADWRAGRRPRIEDYLGAVAEADWPALLRELVALERELRRDAGERPGLREYRDRFPGIELGEQSWDLSGPQDEDARQQPAPYVSLVCPNTQCRARLKVDESMLGRTGRCPGCKMTFVLARPASTVDLGEWSPGQVLLDDYEVEKPLGKGGMGTVYLVRSRSTGQYFAVKTILEDELGDQGRRILIYLIE